jgi:hypothetical protein
VKEYVPTAPWFLARRVVLVPAAAAYGIDSVKRVESFYKAYDIRIEVGQI